MTELPAEPGLEPAGYVPSGARTARAHVLGPRSPRFPAPRKDEGLGPGSYNPPNRSINIAKYGKFSSSFGTPRGRGESKT